MSKKTLKSLLDAGLIYREDEDGFRQSSEEALLKKGPSPFFITPAGRRAVLSAPQLQAVVLADPDGRLADSVPWPTCRSLAALRLVEYRDESGTGQSDDGDNGRQGARDSAFLTPAGMRVAALPRPR
ncbi:hypothetical protein [Streptomyces luteireticuli]|uniref:hypothetical protein n=1 Tax=Streptomyces luteireticuli TaxID=173858 RepID=UPI0035565B9B